MKYLIFSLATILSLAFTPVNSHALSVVAPQGTFSLFGSFGYLSADGSSEILYTVSQSLSSISLVGNVVHATIVAFSGGTSFTSTFSFGYDIYNGSLSSLASNGAIGGATLSDHTGEHSFNFVIDSGSSAGINPIIGFANGLYSLDGWLFNMPFFAYSADNRAPVYGGLFNLGLGPMLSSCPSGCQIPEPMTMSLLAAGLLGGAARKRKKGFSEC